MRYTNYIIVIAVSILFSSCIEKKYFLNPGYGNSMPYHTLPLSTDSSKDRLYFNGSLMTGSGNYNYADDQYAS